MPGTGPEGPTAPAPAARMAAMASLLALAACDGGSGYDYDRYHRDPYAYSFPAGEAQGAPPARSGSAGRAGAADPSGAPQAAGYDRPEAVPPGTDPGFDEILEGARSEPGAGPPETPGEARRREQRLEDAAERDREAIDDARQRRLRLEAETPSPGRSRADIERDRRGAIRGERAIRQGAEIGGQRREASEAILGRRLDAGAADARSATEEFNRRAREGLSGGIIDPRRPAPGGGVPEAEPFVFP